MITPLFLSVLISMFATLPPIAALDRAAAQARAYGASDIEDRDGLFLRGPSRTQVFAQRDNLRDYGPVPVHPHLPKAIVVGGAAGAEAKVDELQKKIDAGEMVKEYVVPMQSKQGDASEHLTLVAINRGYATAQRGSDLAVGGVEFSLRIDFGDIHQELELTEVFTKDAKKRP